MTDRLKERMAARGLSGAQLARAAGVSGSLVSQARHGYRPSSGDGLERIERALAKAPVLLTSADITAATRPPK